MGLALHIGVMKTLGVLVGSDDAQLNEWLASQIAAHKSYLDTLLHPELPTQIALLLLRLCVIPSLGPD